MFTVKERLILFSSNVPGSHATMFGPRGAKLHFRNDHSSFSDDLRAYTWAFDYPGELKDDMLFVFATSERTVVGEVRHGRVRVVQKDTRVARAADGKPLKLLVDVNHLIKTTWTKRADVDPEILTSPKVSILTCTFNRPEMLKDCIDSIRSQTSPDWEHLITDDASSDPAVDDVLDAALDVEPRLRVFRKQKNLNRPAVYWNEMIDRARGKYIAFLDDDNTKYTTFIHDMAGFLDDNPNVDMVTCGWTVIDKDGTTTECHLNLETSESEVSNRNTVDTGALLIRKSAVERIGYFPHHIRTNEDWAMMRRATTCLEIAHLGDVLATYRSHPGQRMESREQLGNDRDQAIVRGQVWGPSYGVRFFYPDLDKLTQSQRDVILGITTAAESIPWIEKGSDLAILLAPFQMAMEDIDQAARSARTTVSVHMEDPYALHPNLERVRAAAWACEQTWVSSNDTSCMEDYRTVVGDRLVVCPSLSLWTDDVRPLGQSKLDVVLVGYAYPSRIAFIRELLRHFDPKKLTLVGDGWKEAGFEAMPTKSFTDSLALYNARGVICLHRQHGDCCDGPREPQLAARGYVEGALGARVFLDASRPDHPFDQGDVEWFDGPVDLAERLETFLALDDAQQAALARPLMLRSKREFTYRERLVRLINSVRSNRTGAVIP